MNVAARFASLAQAIENCRRSDNAEWEERHEERLKLLDLPSGSGFDAGTAFDLEATIRHKCERLVFETDFHHMNDAGYYDGWTHHRVTVYPEWEGVRVVVGGRDRNEIKEYINEVFYSVMAAEAPSCFLKDASAG